MLRVSKTFVSCQQQAYLSRMPKSASCFSRNSRTILQTIAFSHCFFPILGGFLDLKFSLLTALLSFFALPALAEDIPQCVCPVCLFGNHHMWVISSDAMAPTLNRGDCARAEYFDPATQSVDAGDVIIFKLSQNSDQKFVFRVAATAGDTVKMNEGRLWLNGQVVTSEQHEPVWFDLRQRPVPRCRDISKIENGHCPVDRYTETLPNGRSYEVLDLGSTAIDFTGEYHIPDGYVFVLGDHRDNATDSRVPQRAGGIGFVPLENIIGIFTDF